MDMSVWTRLFYILESSSIESLLALKQVMDTSVWDISVYILESSSIEYILALNKY